jgi:predicted lipid carrier protein YhbT
MMIAIPTPLLRALRFIPDAVHGELAARTATHLLRGQYLATRLGALEGKIVRVAVSDVPLDLTFRVCAGGLEHAGAEPPDVTIRGTHADLLKLATREEDPDTLFFQRRLTLEGETETGLHVKNLLDALEYDWPGHFRAVFGEPLGDLAHRAFSLAVVAPWRWFQAAQADGAGAAMPGTPRQ